MATTITGSGVDNIIDGTIVDADINASAAITASKLSGAGKVLNVYHHDSNTTATVSTTSSSFVDSGLTLTVTPVSASSRFIVTYSSAPHQNLTTNWGQTALYRGASRTNITGGVRRNAADEWTTFVQTVHGVDSPNTTSPITYKVKFNSGTSDNWYMHVGSHLNGGDADGATMKLTLTEISS